MTGDVPAARRGSQGFVDGVPITAGLATVRRPIPIRASPADLWADLESVVSEANEFQWLEGRHHTQFDNAARTRIRACLDQARAYYATVGDLPPTAKPLTAYYFALNLVKVFLTITDPASTELGSGSTTHGLSQANDHANQDSLTGERFKVNKAGVFRLLAEQTGAGNCWEPGTTVALEEILPYLPEAHDLSAAASGSTSHLLAVRSVRVLFDVQKHAWLRVEIDHGAVSRHNLTASRVLTKAKAFGVGFRYVSTSGEDDPTPHVHTFESIETVAYTNHRREVAEKIPRLYDAALFASDRSFAGPRRFIPLSSRPDFVSHEAVSFAVLYHLSCLARYRPEDARRILSARGAWLFRSWIDRACENLLLNIVTRVTGRDHVFAA